MEVLLEGSQDHGGTHHTQRSRGMAEVELDTHASGDTSSFHSEVQVHVSHTPPLPPRRVGGDGDG